MRRAIGAVLIGVGAFALVVAILFPTVVLHGAKKTPLNLDITQVSSGPAKVFDTTTGRTNNVTLRATRVVRTDSARSDGTNTTVHETLCIVIVSGPTDNCLPSSDPRLLSFSTDTVAANRRSGESVHVDSWNGIMGGENVDGDTSVRHTGLTYKWPIDSKKRTYQFFLPDLKKAFPAKYVGTGKVRGVDVYKYVAATGDQPYRVQGLIDGTYNDTTTVWVEPQTGAILDGTEHQVQSIPTDAGGTQVVLDAVLRFDKAAIKDQTDYANDAIAKLRLAQLWAPIGGAVIAIAAFIGAFFLLRTRGDVAGTGRHHDNGGPDDGDGGPDDADSQSGGPVLSGSSQT